MKVILQQDVKGQGKKGQLIEASDGYARNFLLPRKLAVPATAENINTMKMQEKAKKAQEAADAHKAAFDFVKETLGDQVKEVKASARLKSHPVCLTAGEGLSFEMEKYFQAVQPDSAIRAERILELNVCLLYTSPSPRDRG